MFTTITFDFGKKATIEAINHVAQAYGISPLTENNFKKVIDWLKKKS